VTRRAVSVLSLAFLAGTVLFGLAVHLSNPVLPDDDAYITYRYADNLLEGHGLVYNPGQRVFGSSTPLYVMWLAGLHGMARSVPTPELAVRVNVIFYVLTTLGIFVLLLNLVGSPGLTAVLAGLLAVNPGLLQASLNGMETFLFTGLMVWSLWALSTRRFGLSAWLAGLSVLARPEGVLMVVVVLVFSALARRNWRDLVGLFVPGLAWVAFATTYFGTPIYHSLLAKSRPLYQLPAGQALGALVNQVALWTVGGWVLLGREALAACLTLLILTLAVAIFGYVRKTRQQDAGDRCSPGLVVSSHEVLGRPDRQALPCGDRASRAVADVLAVPVLLALFVVFYAAANPLLFWWYFPPVDCLWFVALASGVAFAANWLRDRVGSRVGLLPVIVLIVLFGVPELLPYVKRAVARQPATDMKLRSVPVLERTMVYRATAEWLNRAAPPGETLVAPEIGALGYYFRGHVFDACGLVSPEALPFLPVPASQRNGPGAISLELVKHLKCDIVVTMQRFARHSLYPSDWFRQNYELVRQFRPRLPVHSWEPGENTIDVFFRHGGRALRSLRDAEAASGRDPQGHSVNETVSQPIE
jgi:hypothetical protein